MQILDFFGGKFATTPSADTQAPAQFCHGWQQLQRPVEVCVIQSFHKHTQTQLKTAQGKLLSAHNY